MTALPLSIAGVLAWGFYEPDEQQFGAASSPRQVAVSGESVVNWSATHTAQPRCVVVVVVGLGACAHMVATSRLRSDVCTHGSSECMVDGSSCIMLMRELQCMQCVRCA